jgi:hypothetical protein
MQGLNMFNFILLLFLGYIISIALSYYERKRRRKIFNFRFNLRKIHNEINRRCSIPYDDFLSIWQEIAHKLYLNEVYLNPNKKLSEYATSISPIGSDLDRLEHMMNDIFNSNSNSNKIHFLDNLTIAELVCLIDKFKPKPKTR